MHSLSIHATLPKDAVSLYLAIPKRSFARWFQKKAIKGFKQVDLKALHGLPAPFPDHVILALRSDDNALENTRLGEEFLAMSLGVQYSPKRLKAGPLGQVGVIQETAAPRIDRKRKCYEIEHVTVGGFTLTADAYDSRKTPKYPAASSARRRRQR